MDVDRRRGLRAAGLRRSPGGRCARACRSSTGTSTAPGLAAEATIERDARGIPVITAARAPTSRTPPVSRTRRTASSRWICRGASRPASCRSCSARWRSSRTARTRRFGFRAVARRVIEAAPAEERAVIEAYARGVNAGLGSLARASLGIPAAARRAARSGCRKTRCWWCTRCGGSCSTARCATSSTGAAWNAPSAGAQRRRGRARTHHLRLRRPLGVGHA